jgi:hypothetical protein
MSFTLILSDRAKYRLEQLEQDNSKAKRFKAVCKALEYLSNNPRHPSLNTHKYNTLTGKNGEEIFEAYAENNTPAAYRIFWHYGPDKKDITIIAITPHP